MKATLVLSLETGDGRGVSTTLCSKTVSDSDDAAEKVNEAAQYVRVKQAVLALQEQLGIEASEKR